jgi:hypothetical protein
MLFDNQWQIKRWKYEKHSLINNAKWIQKSDSFTATLDKLKKSLALIRSH